MYFITHLEAKTILTRWGTHSLQLEIRTKLSKIISCIITPEAVAKQTTLPQAFSTHVNIGFLGNRISK